MDYRKIVPVVALVLGVAVSVNVAQAADLFQMAEASSHGTLIACDGAKGEHHDAGKKADKGDKVGKADKKSGKHRCGAEKAGKKEAGHKCTADKAEHKGEHHEAEVDNKSADNEE